VKRIVVALCAVALTLAACGSQTDERVSGSATPEAASSEAAASEATDPGEEIAESVAASTPYVTVDCVSGQAMPTDEVPAQGATVDGVTAYFQPNGAPAIAVATDAQPATELGVADVVVGEGAEAQAGDTLTVDYCGVGLGSKTLFDSSYSRGTPATFPLDGVITGWQEGVPGMKVGGTRLLVIPGALAYGANPPPGIGVDETLIFTVTLQSIG
jgi:peptidylprolyl isomerase